MTVVYFGGTVVECLSSDTTPNMPDGWFLKEIDSGLSYIRREGQWADINLGLSFVKATKSGSITSNAEGSGEVQFTTPFSDDDYSVGLSCSDPGGNDIVSAFIVSKTSQGFILKVKKSPSGLGISGIVVSWVATRRYDP